MAAVIRVGEAGKRHRISTSFDMSSNTALALVYTKPDGIATLSVTPTLETGAVTIGGLLAAANTSVFYDFQPGEIDIDGTWTAEFTYTNTSPTPDDIFKNLDPITLVVSV